MCLRAHLHLPSGRLNPPLPAVGFSHWADFGIRWGGGLSHCQGFPKEIIPNPSSPGASSIVRGERSTLSGYLGTSIILTEKFHRLMLSACLALPGSNIQNLQKTPTGPGSSGTPCITWLQIFPGWLSRIESCLLSRTTSPWEWFSLRKGAQGLWQEQLRRQPAPVLLGSALC